MKFNFIANKLWIALTTVAVVGLFLCYYLFVVVPHQEKQLTQKGFRVLNQIDKNLNDKIRNLQKNADFIYNSCNYLAQTQLHQEFSNWQNTHSQESYRVLTSKITEATKKLLGKTYSVDTSFNSYWRKDLDCFYFSHFGIKGKIDLSLQVNYDSGIIKGTLSDSKFFDEFVIAETMTFSKLGKKAQAKAADTAKHPKDTCVSKIRYQTFKNIVKLLPPDSLLSLSHGVFSGGITDATINGSKYKVFVYRMLFNKEDQWTLYGLMKESSFRARAQAVNGGLLFSVLLTFTVILLSLPLLKLAIMSGVERLQITNVFFIGFSLIVGTSILMLIGLSSADYMRVELVSLFNSSESPTQSVEKLACTVETRFVTEVDSAVSQLYSLKEEYPKRKQAFRNKEKEYSDNTKYTFRKDHTGLTSTVLFTSDTALRLRKKYYDQIIWIDAKGDQQLVHTFETIPSFSVPLNLSGRDYFKKIVDKEFWMIHGKPFFIQSISSWFDNQFEAVVSIPLNNETAYDDSEVVCLAMSTPLASVQHPALPPGYSFCIVNGSGDVLFHSNNTKNLQENLIKEAEEDSKLMAALAGRLTDTFVSYYQGKEHYFSVRPVAGTDLSVVALFDPDYLRVKIEMATWTALLLLGALMFVLSFQLILLFIASYQSTKLRIRRFFLSWIRPRTSSAYMKQYFILSIVNLCLGLVPLFFQASRDFLVNYYILLPVYVLSVSFIILEGAGPKKWFSLKTYQSTSKSTFVVLTFSFVFILGLLPSLLGAESIAPFFLTNLLIAFTFFAIYGLTSFLLGWFNFKWDSMSCYYFFLGSWLLAASLSPVYCFYAIGLKEEEQVWTKYNQIATAKEIERLSDKIDHSRYKNLKTEILRLADYSEATGEIARMNSKKAKDRVAKPCRDNDLHKTENKSFVDLLSNQRLSIAELALKTKPYARLHASDSSWTASIGDIIETQYTGHSPESIVLQSVSRGSSSYKQTIAGWMLRIIFSAALGYFLFILFRFVTKRVFGIEIFSNRRASDATVVSLLNKEGNDLFHAQVFLVGLPHSGKLSCIDEVKTKLHLEARHLVEINWKTDIEKNVNDFFGSDRQNIIITHFEHGLNNHEFNQKKLKVLEALQAKASRVIISSSVQSTAILDFYETTIERALSKDKSDEAYTEIKEYRLAFRQWQNILSGFVTVYQSLHINEIKPLKEYDEKEIEDTVRQELKYGNYLLKLEPLISSYYHGIITHEGTNKIHKPDKEDIIIKIETLADAYYQATWNSFTRNEKFLLYDLAKDRFINTRNIKEIKILMEKGVIRMDDSVRLMNKSFNNFILSVVREDEELAMSRELERKGNWKSVQLVLLITLIGLAVFFTLAQQNFLQNFNAFLTAIGTVLALVVRFGGIFGGGVKQKET